MTEKTEQTFRVRDGYMSDLASRFGALEKRAAKLGVPAPTFIVVDTEEVPEFTMLPDGAQVATGRTVTWHTVTVDGQAPKFDGWSMCAVIDRDLDEPNSPNVVNLLPDVELDADWRETGDTCDHCIANGLAVTRGRRKLVVVEHEDYGKADRRIVGTTCLHDFLGHSSPERIAAWIETLSTLGDLLESFNDDDEEYERGGRRIEYRYDPTAFLARTVKVIREYGWTPRSAGEFANPTADIVSEEINWRPSKYRPTAPTAPTADDFIEAEAALAWAVEIDPSNDYLANVQAVATKSGWRHRDIGIGASIVRAYRREMDLIEERKREAATSSPVVTGKITITGEVLSEDWKENDFGTRHVMTVRDDRGFKVWGTVPSKLRINRGDRITFSATVEQSDRDETFGFFKRPTKASVL